MTDVQRIDSRLADTALMVAVCRAIASVRGTHDIDDPYSAAFVSASGVPYWTAFLESGEALLAQSTDFAIKARAMLGHVVARTRFIDRFIEDSIGDSARQLVILGAGFDTRAERLELLDGKAVYEVDIEPVTRFKSSALESAQFDGAHKPILIGADLAGDWLPRLVEAGWDATVPTVWVAEGLLGYLHGPEQEALLLTIAEHSPEGSTALFEYAATISSDTEVQTDNPPMEQFSSDADAALPDLTTLIHVEPRTAPDDFLGRCGWRNEVAAGTEVYTHWFDETDIQVRAAALSPQFDTRFIVSRK
ncbi:SAM-dependent methyltransferase [Rhodococcus sp. SJ-3]|uniref:SAM-dependent methyltransferase n=1 Tax=Rhodococcus sp. SJ-3 TaxID=3454628 RepID=UPI003F7A9CC9